jgi:transposase InsO family protein
MDERVKFIAAYLRGELSMARLCEAFGVSRKTAYKWLARYSDGGVAELVNRSRKPRTNPHAVSQEVEQLIIDARKVHPTWGPKKLLITLAPAYPGLRLPATSTVGTILLRHGLTQLRRSFRRSSSRYTQPFLGYDQPNAVWCADFKGHFRLGDGRRCHPLTISDGCTRYLLRCEGLRQPRDAPSHEVFESAFREFGLPNAIRTDNGSPFSSLSAGGLSALAVWWVKLGIRPERIKPGRPDQNGRHERMHRTLKAETAKPPKADLFAQQSAFDVFRKEYNEVRPHEALGQKPPASAYRPSGRALPTQIAELEYSSEFEVRRINRTGMLKWHGKSWYVSYLLGKEPVGLKEVKGGEWAVHFGMLQLGVLDKASGKLRPIAETFSAPNTGEGSTTDGE